MSGSEILPAQAARLLDDLTSIIADAKFNIDGQEWHVLVPTDGLFDERSENLTFFSGALKGEEHILGLVVTDREGNTVVGKQTTSTHRTPLWPD